jgi:hypothetical protein
MAGFSEGAANGRTDSASSSSYKCNSHDLTSDELFQRLGSIDTFAAGRDD